jgi:AraC family transcriptional regulator
MSLLQRLQKVIEHIDNHLHAELSPAQLADLACVSPFHFQRIFQARCGCTVQDYVRRRRLSEVAQRLSNSDEPIASLALSHGYGSQEALTRAFEKFLGTTPGRYRHERQSAWLQAPLQLAELPAGPGAAAMPEVVERPALRLIGCAYRTSLLDERYFSDIPGFYQAFGERQCYLRIPCRAAPALAYGAAFGFADDGAFSFLVGEEVEAECREAVPAEMTELHLPAGRYAEFTVRGPASQVPATWRYAYGHWLPQSGYERAEGPDYEVTDVCASRFPDLMVGRIYIPLA